MPELNEVTNARIFRVWTPLAATWLMMAVEGPFLAAVIARLPEPTINLAAYGVAFAFAVIVEAPVIMILSASTALVTDPDSYRKLRNFSFGLNAAVTVLMILLLLPPVFDAIALDLISLPPPVAELTHRGLVLLLPWPAAIGFRRFYQGLLIRQELTRRVAMGTVIRVLGMFSGAFVLFRYLELPGALVGTGALASGVVLEAAGTRLMAWGTPARVARFSRPSPSGALSFRKIAEFYFPLALTSMIALAVHPLVTFFLGGSRRSLDSLAVMPVVTSLSFIFRSVGLSYQEVAIALLDGTRENFQPIARFAFAAGAVSTVLLMLIAFTPLAGIWFGWVSGLSPELAEFSILPLRILSPFPLLAMLLAFQRSILVSGRRTRPITMATVIEVTGILIVLYFTIHVLDLVGAVAAVTSLLAGRLLGNSYLLYPCRVVLASTGILPGRGKTAAVLPVERADPSAGKP